MKTTSLNNNLEEMDNLVLFPSSKSFITGEERMNSIYDLLNDGSTSVAEVQVPDHFDERFLEKSLFNSLEEELDESMIFGSLEEFMNRHQAKENLTPDDKLIKFINERLEDIAESKKRIKFYLDEIEMFLPRRR